MKTINGFDVIATQEEINKAIEVLGEDFTETQFNDFVGEFRNPTKTPEQINAHYKALYMQVVQNKLNELDYDSLATVKLWEDDPTFGDEATAILSWYKAVITNNYELINKVESGEIIMPTDEEYLAQLPEFGV
jgi:hypothetical protein